MKNRQNDIVNKVLKTMSFCLYRKLLDLFKKV